MIPAAKPGHAVLLRSRAFKQSKQLIASESSQSQTANRERKLMMTAVSDKTSQFGRGRKR
eukprot:scaffold217190_cov38-Prasinocladus_malaysianus.AAC.2